MIAMRKKSREKCKGKSQKSKRSENDAWEFWKLVRGYDDLKGRSERKEEREYGFRNMLIENVRFCAIKT